MSQQLFHDPRIVQLDRIRPAVAPPEPGDLVRFPLVRKAFIYQRLSTHEQRKKSLWSLEMQDTGRETAMRRGIGKILVEVRRGDGPAAARHDRFSALVSTEALLTCDPAQMAAALRAIVRVQRALHAEPMQAAGVGERRFPPQAAAMITCLRPRAPACTGPPPALTTSCPAHYALLECS